MIFIIITYLLIYLLTYLATYLFTYLFYLLTSYLLACLLQLSFHSVAVVFTLVETKQIRINTHKRNNKKNTVRTIQNIHTPTHYKTS